MPGTDEHAAAAQAYLRLLFTTQAALGADEEMRLAAELLAGPLADADHALAAAGLAGNEAQLFTVTVPTADQASP